MPNCAGSIEPAGWGTGRGATAAGGERARLSRIVSGRAGRRWVGCLVVAIACAVHAQPPSLDYQVKASYLYNFTQFIEWPADVFAATGHFNLCVIGLWRFGDALEPLRGERVQGRELVVRTVDSVDQAVVARCHLLFVPAARTRAVPIERGLLTVGETPRFLARGGMVNLVELRGRIRFEINARAAEQAGLGVSSRLLRLALDTHP